MYDIDEDKIISSSDLVKFSETIPHNSSLG